MTIESALEHARDAAGGKDVMLWGGAQVVNQYLVAGLLKRARAARRSSVAQRGCSPLRQPRGRGVQLEQLRAVEAPGVTHLKYDRETIAQAILEHST